MKNFKMALVLSMITALTFTNVGYAKNDDFQKSKFNKAMSLTAVNKVLKKARMPCVVLNNATEHHTNTMHFSRLRTAENCRKDLSYQNKYCNMGRKLDLSNNRNFNLHLASINWASAIATRCAAKPEPKKQEPSPRTLHRYNTRLGRKCRIKAVGTNGFNKTLCTVIHYDVEKEIKSQKIKDKWEIREAYDNAIKLEPKIKNQAVNRACHKLVSGLGVLANKVKSNSLLGGGIAANLRACENQGFKVPTKLKRKYLTLKKKGAFRRR